jgi:sulfate/thiosulfate transport system permease protein
MANVAATKRYSAAGRDPAYVRWTLIGAALAVMGLLVVVPIVAVFHNALGHGPATYWRMLAVDADTRHAVLLTLTVAPIAVAANLVFGVAAAWTIARFRFRGRALLTSLIDLPFSVSPVVAGLSLVLIFGLQGYLGPWLREHNIRVIFALPWRAS